MEWQIREVKPTDKSLTSEQASFMASGRIKIWVCEVDSHQIGHCEGLPETGEIFGISVNNSYRRQRIGTRLLSRVIESLRAAGCNRIWVDASAHPSTPAYNFYRTLGWQSTGKQTQGDPFPSEILELPGTAV
jgi:ribosomal protein S18 acetylase RimI-like enzyme